MRVVWVPQWAVLPVIVEDPAMIEGHGSGVSGSSSNGPSQDTNRPSRVGASESYGAPRPGQVLQPQNVNGLTFSQMAPQTARRTNQAPFDMTTVAAALPDYHGFSSPQSSSFDTSNPYSTSPNAVSAFQGAAFAGQMSPGAYAVNSSNYFPYAPEQSGGVAHTGFAVGQGAHQHQTASVNPMHSNYSNVYYAGHQSRQHQLPQYMPYGAHYGHPVQLPYQTQIPSGTASTYNTHGELTSSGSSRSGRGGFTASGNFSSMHAGHYPQPANIHVPPRVNPQVIAGNIPSTPRGPPRKPKQSGNALWVGNLPSGTLVADLKDHFSKDATKEIESVFLISKSNCAFVNYRSERACADAMTRFHDSRFHGVRLVCRLRRTTTATTASGIPTGPAALTAVNSQNQSAIETINQNRENSSKAAEQAATEASRNGEPTSKTPDKYFVMKSLTIEDMELSVRNSIWATQAHNEEALNRAYESTANVFLIFSANKSGEYFGFARMASSINDEAAAGLDWAPRGHVVVDDPDVPRSIPTPATDTAPKGRIIDDSARGTIFWEADLPEDDEQGGGGAGADADVDGNEAESTSTQQEQQLSSHESTADEGDDTAPGTTGDTQAFGKPFKIEWVTTTRLPFYRTRGLRNPWNANREVKIARDGTELETGVGRRLVQMFSRGDQPVVGYGQVQ